MKQRAVSFASLASLALLVAVGSLGCSSESVSVLDQADDALSVSAAARVGTLEYGATATIAYTASPRYRAYSFVASAGDTVELVARSTDGDPVLWLTNSAFATLEKNDDVATGDTTARIEHTLKAAGTYWIVVSEADRHAARISVALNLVTPVLDTGAAVADSGVAPPVTFTTCPDGRGDRCFTLSGTCYDGFQCPVQGSLDVESFVNGTFRWESGALWPVSGSASQSVAGDEFNKVMFREGHSAALDGKEHGIASTGRNNDVYAMAIEKADRVELTVRFASASGSPYRNGATCSHPRGNGAGACVLSSRH